MNLVWSLYQGLAKAIRYMFFTSSLTILTSHIMIVQSFGFSFTRGLRSQVSWVSVILVLENLSSCMWSTLMVAIDTR